MTDHPTTAAGRALLDLHELVSRGSLHDCAGDSQRIAKVEAEARADVTRLREAAQRVADTPVYANDVDGVMSIDFADAMIALHDALAATEPK